MMDRNYYLALRKRYEPETVKLIVVAESPPRSGRYFYDKLGAVTEPLFAAFMQRLDIVVVSKEEGLLEFQRRGWILVDATYEPVNGMSVVARDAVIARDYSLLRDDLTSLHAIHAAPIVLVKANVCRILEPKLTADGFNVLNRGSAVYFPSTGHQNNFKQQFTAILEAAGIWPLS